MPEIERPLSLAAEKRAVLSLDHTLLTVDLEPTEMSPRGVVSVITLGYEEP